jgi:hypothetical protein
MSFVVWRDSAGNVIDVIHGHIGDIAMQRLDFDFDGGAETKTIPSRTEGGEPTEFRQRVRVRGRVVVNETDITIEVDGKGPVQVVTLQELIDAPALDPVRVPEGNVTIVGETATERHEREIRERELREAGLVTPEHIEGTKAEALAAEKTAHEAAARKAAAEREARETAAHNAAVDAAKEREADERGKRRQR